MNLFILLVFILFNVCTGSENLDKSAASMRILITSGIRNAPRRRACRSTWLTWVKPFKELQLSYAFYVEAPVTRTERDHLRKESSLYKDIVVINSTAPRDMSPESCAFRRWEVMSHVYGQFQDKVDFYVLADDDSFICIHHLLSDSKYWPVGDRVHIAHFRQRIPDVISIYSSMLVKDALHTVSTNTNITYKTKPLNYLVTSGAVGETININEIRLTYGARGTKDARYNDFVNGWVGGDLLNATEKSTICNRVLSLHQAYPTIMGDVWKEAKHASPSMTFNVPALSRNIVDLDVVPI